MNRKLSLICGHFKSLKHRKLGVLLCIVYILLHTMVLSAQQDRPTQPKSRVKGQSEQTLQDPDFPDLELREVPLEVPRGFITGTGYVRAEELYREAIIELSTGYFASMLNLFSVSDSVGNSNNNTRETEWNNLYNIMASVQVSGDPNKVHYDVWFAIPFNLGLDTIQLRNYEFGSATVDNNRNKDDISYRGTFASKLTFMLLGGGEMGFHVVNRKSAKLTVGGGIEGMLAEWDIIGGNYRTDLQVNLTPGTSDSYDNEKSLKLITGHVLPYAYIQAGVFLTPFLEVSARLGYSPAMLWFSDETRFRESETASNPNTPTEYDSVQFQRYGYFGQTVLGEVYARLWIGRRYNITLGAKGRYTFKTPGTLRTYDDVDGDGNLLDPTNFTLTNNASALQNFQISVTLGVGIALDGILPPGRKYEMPF